ncbi:MAG: hypothetical protein FWJ85_03295 [Solitalea sp.]
MKSQFTFRLFGLAIAASMLLLAGCEKEENRPDREKPFLLEANLLLGNDLFAHTLGERNSENAFEILEIVRTGDELEVTVKGTDEAGSFQFIWDGRVQESYPMGIRLIMVYHGAQDAFDPEKEATVAVNLQKIIGERNHIGDYHFYLVNGSQIQTVTLNPDGTISSEDE